MPRLILDVDLESAGAISHILENCVIDSKGKLRTENMRYIFEAFRKASNPAVSTSRSGIAVVITPSSHVVTFTGAPVNNNTLTIMGTTITAKTTVVDALVQFALGANKFEAAQNLCDLLNSTTNSTISGKLIARVQADDESKVLVEGVGGIAITVAVGTMPNASVGSSVAASSVTQKAFGYTQ